MSKVENRKTVPRYVAVLLVLLTLSMFVFTVTAAITSYVLFKPYVTGIIMSASPVKVESLSFNYDLNAEKWSTVSVVVNNTDTAPRGGSIGVFLYDASSTKIVTGTQSYNLAAKEAMTVIIDLSWTPGKNVTDVARGEVVVSVS